MTASVQEREAEVRLRAAAAARGALVLAFANGHFQIRGALVVNYYPFAKRRTAYVSATTRGIRDASIDQAVALAFEAPAIARGDTKAERGNSGRYKRWKQRMWNRGFRLCHWCSLPMNRVHADPLQMTVDHKIPLARGGLDNPNNWVGAHSKCNSARGSDMPEISREKCS